MFVRALWWTLGITVVVAGLLVGRGGLDTSTSPAAVPSTGPSVSGALDLVREEDGAVRIEGWALRSDGAPTVLRILADGSEVAQLQTGTLRPDVAAAYGTRAVDAGYTGAVTLHPSVRTICVDAVDPAGTSVRVGCRPLHPDDPGDPDLQALLDDLATEAEAAIPGYRVAIAVVRHDQGAVVGHGVDELFISASTAKAWWTAAALANGERDAAAMHAGPVFEISDDIHAGSMIDLAGGIDAVNDFTRSLGMEDTAAIRWGKGAVRISVDWPGRLGGSNHTTAGDAARFMYRLATNQVLAPGLTQDLLAWMRTTPRSAETTPPGWASTIPDSLPGDIRDAVAHKAGWLEPFVYSVDAHLLDAGYVTTAPGHGYAIAMIGAGPQNAASYDRLTRFFEAASCSVYAAVAEDDWSCPDW